MTYCEYIDRACKQNIWQSEKFLYQNIATVFRSSILIFSPLDKIISLPYYNVMVALPLLTPGMAINFADFKILILFKISITFQGLIFDEI